MTLPTDYYNITTVLDNILNKPNTSKWLIGVLVQYLCEDGYWVKENISTVDKEMLVELVNKIK